MTRIVLGNKTKPSRDSAQATGSSKSPPKLWQHGTKLLSNVFFQEAEADSVYGKLRDGLCGVFVPVEDALDAIDNRGLAVIASDIAVSVFIDKGFSQVRLPLLGKSPASECKRERLKEGKY